MHRWFLLIDLPRAHHAPSVLERMDIRDESHENIRSTVVEGPFIRNRGCHRWGSSACSALTYDERLGCNVYLIAPKKSSLLVVSRGQFTFFTRHTFANRQSLFAYRNKKTAIQLRKTISHLFSSGAWCICQPGHLELHPWSKRCFQGL